MWIADDVYTRFVVDHTPLDFGTVYQDFDYWASVIYDRRSGACFREQRGDGLAGCLHPCFHCLSKPWYEVQELTHGECDGTVRESFPDWVLVGGGLTLGYRRSRLLSHPCQVGSVGFCYPFLGRSSYTILFFPF